MSDLLDRDLVAGVGHRGTILEGIGMVLIGPDYFLRLGFYDRTVLTRCGGACL
jgi:hypothetical protein